MPALKRVGILCFKSQLRELILDMRFPTGSYLNFLKIRTCLFFGLPLKPTGRYKNRLDGTETDQTVQAPVRGEGYQRGNNSRTYSGCSRASGLH